MPALSPQRRGTATRKLLAALLSDRPMAAPTLPLVRPARSRFRACRQIRQRSAAGARPSEVRTPAPAHHPQSFVVPPSLVHAGISVNAVDRRGRLPATVAREGRCLSALSMIGSRSASVQERWRPHSEMSAGPGLGQPVAAGCTAGFTFGPQRSALVIGTRPPISDRM